MEELISDLKSRGLEAGHILAVHLPSNQTLINLMFASIQIGAIFCPLNLRLPKAAIQTQLKILRPKLFISEEGIQSFVSEKTPLLPSSFLLFTSGSSGSPKIVNLSLSNFVAAAKSAIEVCNFEPGDLWLLSLPLYHVGGLSILFRCLLANASFTFDSTDRAITHVSYVPTQLYRAWPIYPKLKTILLSGAPIHDIPEQLPIVAAYGMTETASMIIGQKNAPKEDGFYYLGNPHPGKELTLSDEGEILIRGDSLFQGYWNGTELQEPSEWFATNDLGRFDSKNGFAIVGRMDNQFISGGENIQPEEIEKELLTYPTILEATVVPKQDAEFGERPVAFIRSNEKINEEALKNYLLDRLPKYKIPTEFLVLEDVEGLKPSRKQLQIYCQDL